jgi:plasmid stabilization system protein ParE
VNWPIFVKPAARDDAAVAARWYRDLSPVLADRFLSSVREAIEKVAMHPTAHPIVDPETGTRRIRLKGFPYRVFYLVELTRGCGPSESHAS